MVVEINISNGTAHRTKMPKIILEVYQDDINIKTLTPVPLSRKVIEGLSEYIKVVEEHKPCLMSLIKKLTEIASTNNLIYYD